MANVEGDEADAVEGMLTAGAADGAGAVGVGAEGAVCEGGGREAEVEAVEVEGVAETEGVEGDTDASGGGAFVGLSLLLFETDPAGSSDDFFSLPPNARSFLPVNAPLPVPSPLGLLRSSPSSQTLAPNLYLTGMVVIRVETVRAGAREGLRGA